MGDNIMAASLIDRVLHHCHLGNIGGNSYRMREHSELWQTLTRRWTGLPGTSRHAENPGEVGDVLRFVNRG